MLQWLYNQVSWLIARVNDAWNFIASFVSNPYPYIHLFLSWVYDRAVYYTNLTKAEIAKWTYSLYLEFINWRNWFNTLIQTHVLPIVGQVQGWLQNLPNLVSQIVSSLVQGLVAWVVGQIQWVSSLANQALGLFYQFQGWVLGWVSGLLAPVMSDIYWLKQIVGAINFQTLVRSIDEIGKSVANVPKLIEDTALIKLLDWLEDRLGEALE